MTGPDGQIDFEHDRSLYSVGSGWRLYSPGREYIGVPGHWESFPLDELNEDDPFWLLAIVAATVSATYAGKDRILGESLDRYTARADLAQAQASRGLPVALPSHAIDPRPGESPLDVSDLKLDLWFDAPGRIRRATLHHGRDSLTQIELSGFGETGTIELPASAEITTAYGSL